MKFIVQRDLIFSALQRIQSVVEKKNTIPILANVLFQVKGNEPTVKQI